MFKVEKIKIENINYSFEQLILSFNIPKLAFRSTWTINPRTSWVTNADFSAYELVMAKYFAVDY